MIKILTLLSLLFLVGCAGQKTLELAKLPPQKTRPSKNLVVINKMPPKKQALENLIFAEKKVPTEECSVPVLTAEEKALKRSVKLLKQYLARWRSVRYRLGGRGRRGIDCSAFVQNAFKKQFNLKLPRNTYSQVKLGKTIPKSKLKTGDLVFFRTSRRTRHVGIYLKDNQFIHASSSKGVTQSSLNNVYWARKYWKAKRIAFKPATSFNELIGLGQV